MDGLFPVERPLDELRSVVKRVAAARNLGETSRDAWVNAVMAKLNDVEVYGLRQFVEAALTVNRRLQNRGFRQLHLSTLKLMLRAACDVLFEEGARAGSLADGDSADDPMPQGFEEQEDAAAVVVRREGLAEDVPEE